MGIVHLRVGSVECCLVYHHCLYLFLILFVQRLYFLLFLSLLFFLHFLLSNLGLNFNLHIGFAFFRHFLHPENQRVSCFSLIVLEALECAFDLVPGESLLRLNQHDHLINVFFLHAQGLLLGLLQILFLLLQTLFDCLLLHVFLIVFLVAIVIV